MLVLPCIGRMPEEEKTELKRLLWKEVEAAHPDLAPVAVADAAQDNWTFLFKHGPAAEAVDSRHACEHPATVLRHARDPNA